RGTGGSVGSGKVGTGGSGGSGKVGTGGSGGRGNVGTGGSGSRGNVGTGGSGGIGNVGTGGSGGSGNVGTGGSGGSGNVGTGGSGGSGKVGTGGSGGSSNVGTGGIGGSGNVGTGGSGGSGNVGTGGSGGSGNVGSGGSGGSGKVGTGGSGGSGNVGTGGSGGSGKVGTGGSGGSGNVGTGGSTGGSTGGIKGSRVNQGTGDSSRSNVGRGGSTGGSGGSGNVGTVGSGGSGNVGTGGSGGSGNVGTGGSSGNDNQGTAGVSSGNVGTDGSSSSGSVNTGGIIGSDSSSGNVIIGDNTRGGGIGGSSSNIGTGSSSGNDGKEGSGSNRGTGVSGGSGAGIKGSVSGTKSSSGGVGGSGINVDTGGGGSSGVSGSNRGTGGGGSSGVSGNNRGTGGSGGSGSNRGTGISGGSGSNRVTGGSGGSGSNRGTGSSSGSGSNRGTGSSRGSGSNRGTGGSGGSGSNRGTGGSGSNRDTGSSGGTGGSDSIGGTGGSGSIGGTGGSGSIGGTGGSGSNRGTGSSGGSGSIGGTGGSDSIGGTGGSGSIGGAGGSGSNRGTGGSGSNRGTGGGGSSGVDAGGSQVAGGSTGGGLSSKPDDSGKITGDSKEDNVMKPSTPSLLGILTNKEPIDVETTKYCVFGVENPLCVPCRKYTYYSKVGSDKQFYHCNYGVLYILECPTETAWSSRLGSCVYESNPKWSQGSADQSQVFKPQEPSGVDNSLSKVNISFVPVSSTNTPKMEAVDPNETTMCLSEYDYPHCIPCTNDYFYPKYNSLLQFYQCRHSTLVLLQCPENTIWDGRSIKCLYDMMHISFDPQVSADNSENSQFRWRTDLAMDSRRVNDSEEMWPTREPVDPLTSNLCIYEVNNSDCRVCEKGSYYPKFDSVAEFYQCSHGYLFLMQCPDATIWHGESLRCIYDEEEFNSTNFYNGSMGMEAINPNDTSLCIIEINETECDPCWQGGYYPVIGSLSQFFQCSHGVLVPMVCPARTIWNNRILRCVYDSTQVWLPPGSDTDTEGTEKMSPQPELEVEYPAREPISANTTNLCVFKVNNSRCYPCQEGSYYPKYQSQSQFYQCSQGLLFLMHCPENTIWHGRTIRCIYDKTLLWRLAAIEIKKDAALANNVPVQSLTPKWPQIPAGHVDLSQMCLFDHQAPGCQHCVLGVTYSHPFRQDLYYECVEGILSPKLCPEGMWWHQMAAQCVHKDSYNTTFSQRPLSIYEPIDTATTPLCVFDTNNTQCIPCQPNSYYPKYKSIAQFYQCSHGLLFLMQCPAKTVWDETTIKCIYGSKRYWYAFVVKNVEVSKTRHTLREILHKGSTTLRGTIA
ncbi:hypothetical protein Ahia01_000154400, partial [Argonauta hians]